jgi:hypothetical protein
MKKVVIVFTSILFSSSVFGQNILEEKTELRNGLVLYKTLNLDLKCEMERYVKEIPGHYDNFFGLYEFNPETEKLSKFSNVLYDGYIENNLITNENDHSSFIHYIKTPLTSRSYNDENHFVIVGDINQGILDGKYIIYKSIFNPTDFYDPYGTIEFDYQNGFKRRDMSRYDQSSRFSSHIYPEGDFDYESWYFNVDFYDYENTIGYIEFEDGLYKSYEIKYDGLLTKSTYEDGFVQKYVQYDLINDSYIDSFTVDSKVYMSKGKWFKNQYPKLISLIDSIKNGSSINCDQINNQELPREQFVVISDPLNGDYGISHELSGQKDKYGRGLTRRYGSFNRDIISPQGTVDSSVPGLIYRDQNLRSLWVLPFSYNFYTSQIGISNSGRYPNIKIPSIFKLINISETECLQEWNEKYDSYQHLVKYSLFKYDIDLKFLVHKYGTFKGYKIYSYLLSDSYSFYILQKIYSCDIITISDFEDLMNYPNQ